MKNADKPINPLKGAGDIFFDEREESYIKEVKPLIGLTKREYFAGLALQGIIAGRKDELYKIKDETIKIYAKLSIKSADELLKQLENK